MQSRRIGAPSRDHETEERQRARRDRERSRLQPSGAGGHDHAYNPPGRAWLSATARAILAVAVHNGAPLDMSFQDDAVRCVVAEHLVRCEGYSISEALLLARADVTDSHLRGIVRFASTLGNPGVLSRLLGGKPVRSMSRQESLEAALLLFTSATIDAFPPSPAKPRKNGEIDESFGPLIGRCTACVSPIRFGHCTIAIAWPIAKPRWETITPTVATDARRGRNKTPERGSKLRMLHDGDLPMLCMSCTMRMRHAGWLPPEPPIRPPIRWFPSWGGA